MRSTIGYGLEFTSDDITKLFPTEVAASKEGCDEDDWGYLDLHEILETYVKDAGVNTEIIDFVYSVDGNDDPKSHHVIYFTLHESKAHYQGKISMSPQIPAEILNRVTEFKERYPILNEYSWKLLFISNAEL